jgi:hypothetical protein
MVKNKLNIRNIFGHNNLLTRKSCLTGLDWNFLFDEENCLTGLDWNVLFDFFTKLVKIKIRQSGGGLMAGRFPVTCTTCRS